MSFIINANDGRVLNGFINILYCLISDKNKQNHAKNKINMLTSGNSVLQFYAQ